MTTSQKLWLGFGTLTALLVLSSVAIIVRVRSIEGQVGEMVNARDLSAAARQMEVNMLGYALHVRTHLLMDEPQARQAAVEDAADVERHLKEYQRLATTEQQRQNAARFVASWEEMKKLDGALLETDKGQRQLDDSKRFFSLHTGLEKLLDEEIQAEAVENYNAHRDAALEDVRTIVNFALILLGTGAAVALATSGTVGSAVLRGERAIAEQRERLRTTLASIGDAVITTDTGGRVTNLNAVAESLTGWRNAEAAGQPLDAVFRIVNEETRKTVENPATKALAEGAIVGLANHTVLIAKDGSERGIDDSAAPIRCKQGEIVGCVLVFRDITERRRADRELRESEERRRFIMDSAPQKLFTATPDGAVDYFNPQWTEFTGLSFEEIRDWGWKQFIHPDDVDETVRIWRHSLDTGEPFSIEHRFRQADGNYRWHFSRALPQFDEAGTVIMWTGSNTDIHEQKKTAIELRQLAADLSEGDRRKNEFLAMLAHELRNPLAPIRNALQIVQLSAGNGEAVHAASEMMERQIGQMVRLVDDLLDVSRISRGKIDLRRERVELASIIAQAVETCRPAVECARHELTVTLPPQPVYLNADPVRLGQVFSNLLNNACKYSEPEGRISLSAERQGSDVVVAVKDTGVGIPPAMLPHVFEMFTQVDRSLERSQGGLGIGLTLVQRLVEMHGGSVSAQSDGPGQGSEFVVRLPMIIEVPKPLPDEQATSEQSSVTGRRILVVDDNRDSATSLAMLLRLTGNETQTAYDGLEAVETAATFQPDVVLLDIGLPKLNGYEAARKIREHSWGKSMVLVALTGWGQEEDRRKSKDAGFDSHLVKPVDLAALKKLLGELLKTPV